MKVFLKILAAFMSVILVVLLIAAPVFSFASNAIRKDTINSLVTSPEIKDEIADSMSFEGNEEKEFMERFLKSKCFDDIYTKATDSIFAPLYGEKSKPFTESDVNRIIDKNIDELTDIFISSKIGGEELTKEEARKAVREIFSESAPDIAKGINEVRGELDLSEAVLVIKIIKICLCVCIAAIIILTGLIFLCTFRKFNGFIWLCADYGVAVLLCAAVINVFKFIFSDIASGDRLLGIIVKIFTEKATSTFNTTMIIYTVIAIICLATAITGKVLSAKKKNKTVESDDITTEDNITFQAPNYPQQTEVFAPQGQSSDTQQEQKPVFTNEEQFSFVNNSN